MCWANGVGMGVGCYKQVMGGWPTATQIATTLGMGIESKMPEFVPWNGIQNKHPEMWWVNGVGLGDVGYK